MEVVPAEPAGVFLVVSLLPPLARLASAAAGWHSPALAASALGLRRSAGTGRSVGFFEAKNLDITKVAVMKFRH